MTESAPATAVSPADTPAAGGWRILFVVVLLLHLLLATRNWSSGALPGHEFRQAQTALSAHAIQSTGDFSVAYPTPVLGKPWSIPMEFPLYQWGVVGLSNAGGLTLVQAARSLSLACFYLMLPGMFVLMRAMGVAPGARWLGLTLVLSCPLYLFYSRAFMIESLALLLAVWFLAAYLRAMQSGRWGWVVLAAAAGIGAALVKVTTLIIWMSPAAVHGCLMLFRSRRAGWVRFWQTLLRGLLIATGPCVAAVWWVQAADRIKALNPSARFLMSGPMRAINFSGWSERWQADMWLGILRNWDQALMPVWLMAGLLLVLLAGDSRRRLPVVMALAVFLAAQFTFPQLFAWHDYYLYAVGLFWLGAAGIILHGMMTIRRGRSMAAILVLLVVWAEGNSYRLHYYPQQTAAGAGGSGLTEALRALTPRTGVLLIAGNDWSSVIPYYAQRRALMIRTSTEKDEAYLTAAFKELEGEQVAALVVSGVQRGNESLIAQAVATFDLDPAVAFSHQDTDVYLRRSRRDSVLAMLHDAPVFDQVVPRGQPMAAAITPDVDRETHAINGHSDRPLFGHMSPMPSRYRFNFAPAAGTVDGQPMVMAHPDSELWFVPPPDMQEIVFHFGVLPDAYERAGGATDGVEFIISEKRTNGPEVPIFRRWLQPVATPSDRGRQHVVLSHRSPAGAELVFSTRPGGNYNYDWAYWGIIRMR